MCDDTFNLVTNKAFDKFEQILIKFFNQILDWSYCQNNSLLMVVHIMSEEVLIIKLCFDSIGKLKVQSQVAML